MGVMLQCDDVQQWQPALVVFWEWIPHPQLCRAGIPRGVLHTAGPDNGQGPAHVVDRSAMPQVSVGRGQGSRTGEALAMQLVVCTHARMHALIPPGPSCSFSDVQQHIDSL